MRPPRPCKFNPREKAAFPYRRPNPSKPTLDHHDNSCDCCGSQDRTASTALRPSRSSKSPRALPRQIRRPRPFSQAPPTPPLPHRLPLPTGTNAAAASPPSELRPMDSQFPSRNVRSRTVHGWCDPTGPPTLAEASRPRSTTPPPSLKNVSKHVFQSRHRHRQAAAPAASAAESACSCPASPRDNPSQCASPRPATAANIPARWPCRPTEPCPSASSASSNATRAMR